MPYSNILRLILGFSLSLSLTLPTHSETRASNGFSSSESAAVQGSRNRCNKHPETWEEALLREEKKQWPQAARKQPAMNLSGVYLFNGAPEGKTCRQYIWQECLEVTIAGGCTDNATGAVTSGSPVHHYVLDYAYGHSDMFGKDKCSNPTNGNCYEALGPTLNKALIVESTREWCETYGTEHAVMLVGPLLKGDNSGPGAVGWNAIRAIDRDGSLVFVQNPNAVEEGAQETSILKRATDQSIQCENPGFNPNSKYCKNRSYLDAAWSFTPACCSANPDLGAYKKYMDLGLYPAQDVQAFPNGPNLVACDKSSPARRY